MPNNLQLNWYSVKYVDKNALNTEKREGIFDYISYLQGELEKGIITADEYKRLVILANQSYLKGNIEQMKKMFSSFISKTLSYEQQ